MSILATMCNVSKRYKNVAALDDVTFTIEQGNVITIVGKNASGKSTLLLLLAGLLRPSSGSIEWRPGSLITIGYAPDRLPQLNFTPRQYLQHMGFMQGMQRDELRREIDFRLEQFALIHAADRDMRGFSKGMLQKVNLAQALLGRPELLLLDEPLGGVDEETQITLIQLLCDLREQGITVLASTHEPQLVQQAAQQVLVLEYGRLVAQYDPHHVLRTVQQIVCTGISASEVESLLSSEQTEWMVDNHGDRIRVAVEKEAGDRLLMKLIQSGASIVSVHQDAKWSNDIADASHSVVSRGRKGEGTTL
ncbi:ATP-binding cassette domain-containing protein [Paenibacillus peoriae]|uniref:ATP-binding cassette domain-containing protein n=1 Tax=Paenibacillus TaxID=44249 RepID=UPI0023798422|nr:ATP-binding cassette domain-containing protein [Paenibacillus polymyxa]WDM23934.1 ATP-binding cassette domain-containing protein [Paenibacillus polymyxa]